MLRRLVLVSMSAFALRAAANAADIYVAPSTEPAGYKDAWYPTWSGYYLGVNGGYGWGKGEYDWSAYLPAAFGAFPCGTAGLGNPFCPAGTDRTKFNGALGGVQAGVNVQRSQFVYGIEADFDVTRQKGAVASSFSGVAGGLASTLTVAQDEKIDSAGDAAWSARLFV
jgi:outer membrane immunogenic protein